MLLGPPSPSSHGSLQGGQGLGRAASQLLRDAGLRCRGRAHSTSVPGLLLPGRSREEGGSHSCGFVSLTCTCLR